MTVRTKKQLLVLLTVKTLIFLAVIVAPFMVRAPRYYFVGGYSGIGAETLSCKAGSELSPTNQCVSWETSSAVIPAIVVIGAVALASTLLITFRPSGQRLQEWFKLEVWVTILALVAAVVLQSILHFNSQASGFSSANQLATGQWVITNLPRFGIGLSGNMVFILALLFSLPLVYRLYITYISKQHFNGQKKKDLFQ